MSYNVSDAPASYLPTTEYFDKDLDKSMDKLTTVYSDIAKQVNSKETARYELTELLTGQQFYDTTDTQTRRFTYRKCFTFGAILPGATLLIPHGITGIPSAAHPTYKTRFTRITGTYLDSDWWQKPIVYASNASLNFQFDIKIDDTNIVLVNGNAGTTAVISGQITLEYLKN